MKSFIYILLTSLTFLVVGCQNESEEIRLINQAERLFDGASEDRFVLGAFVCGG